MLRERALKIVLVLVGLIFFQRVSLLSSEDIVRREGILGVTPLTAANPVCGEEGKGPAVGR